MKARGGGRIVNISSIGGKIAMPHLLPVHGRQVRPRRAVQRPARANWPDYGVVVTTVCPGLMRTGSHLNAEFKGRHEEEYRWFALGNAVPGFSIGAETRGPADPRRRARGDAEVVLSLPAKVAVALQALFPNLMAGAAALANHYLLPDAGGVGRRTSRAATAAGSRLRLPRALTDRAADANNERHAGRLTAQPT